LSCKAIAGLPRSSIKRDMNSIAAHLSPVISMKRLSLAESLGVSLD
jgi:hypothetical protein